MPVRLRVARTVRSDGFVVFHRELFGEDFERLPVVSSSRCGLRGWLCRVVLRRVRRFGVERSVAWFQRFWIATILVLRGVLRSVAPRVSVLVGLLAVATVGWDGERVQASSGGRKHWGLDVPAVLQNRVVLQNWEARQIQEDRRAVGLGALAPIQHCRKSSMREVGVLLAVFSSFTDFPRNRL